MSTMIINYSCLDLPLLMQYDFIMINIRELLKDPVYKKYFCQVPQLPDIYTPESKPWRLMVLKKNEAHWKGKRFGTYAEAFKALKRILPHIDDAAINSPALDFNPPLKSMRIKGQFLMVGKKKVQKTKLVTWTPKLSPGDEEHNWCPHCRRPSTFEAVYQHSMMPRKKLGGVGIDPTQRRCVICGIPDTMINLRKPMAHQRWDNNK